MTWATVNVGGAARVPFPAAQLTGMTSTLRLGPPLGPTRIWINGDHAVNTPEPGLVCFRVASTPPLSRPNTRTRPSLSVAAATAPPCPSPSENQPAQTTPAWAWARDTSSPVVSVPNSCSRPSELRATATEVRDPVTGAQPDHVAALG